MLRSSPTPFHEQCTHSSHQSLIPPEPLYHICSSESPAHVHARDSRRRTPPLKHEPRQDTYRRPPSARSSMFSASTPRFPGHFNTCLELFRCAERVLTHRPISHSLALLPPSESEALLPSPRSSRALSHAIPGFARSRLGDATQHNCASFAPFGVFSVHRHGKCIFSGPFSLQFRLMGTPE